MSVAPKRDVVKMLHPQVPQAKESLTSVSTDSMGSGAHSARSVEEQASVTTGDSAIIARSVEEPASVITDGNAVGARSVEEPASVSTGGNADGARSVNLIHSNYRQLRLK
jgi:hypothetical protein